MVLSFVFSHLAMAVDACHGPISPSHEGQNAD